MFIEEESKKNQPASCCVLGKKILPRGVEVIERGFARRDSNSSNQSLSKEKNWKKRK